MENGTRTETRNKIIAAFLKENNLFPKDLAKYLEIEHQYGCYKESEFD
jgi:hypothetical protein